MAFNTSEARKPLKRIRRRRPRRENNGTRLELREARLIILLPSVFERDLVGAA